LDLAEDRQQPSDTGVGDAIVQYLRFPSGLDDPARTEPGEMLGNRGLPQTHRKAKRSDRHLARQREMMQDEKPFLVGEKPQNGTYVGCLVPQNLDIGRGIHESPQKHIATLELSNI
jgi:hypothetical protein